MKNLKTLFVLMVFSLAMGLNAQDSFFNPEVPDIVQYTVIPDVKYGEAKVKQNGEVSNKDLTMDVYYPSEESNEARPAIILSYGGSFHRGNPRSTYNGYGGQTTSMSQYAQRFAAEGYVVFTINYRVATDNPLVDEYSGYTEEDLDASFLASPAAVSQINIIRAQMGLSALTADNAEEVLKAAVLAGAEDLTTAIKHVKMNNEKYQINPDKIALGGFSAGGSTSINVAYGIQEEVAAVFTNSGFPAVYNMEKLVNASSDLPPLLAFVSQHDYPVVKHLMPDFIKLLKQNNVEYQFNWVPGFGHFYPSGSTILTDDGYVMPLEQLTINFLNGVLK